MANKFCTSCGTPIQGNERFCTGCGQPAENHAPAAEPVTAAVTDPAMQEPEAKGEAPAPQPAEPTPGRAYAPPPPQAGPTPQAYASPPLQNYPPPQAYPYPPQQPYPYLPQASGAYAQAPDTPPTGKYAPIGLGGWLGIMLLMLIPIVNIILIIVWACGGCKRVTQRSFARATLIFMAVMVVLSLTIGYFAKKAFNTFLNETGIFQEFGGIPGQGFGDFSAGSQKHEVAGALEEMFPDGRFDEQTLIDQGYEDWEIDVIRAVVEKDREALLDMGYSQEEINGIFNMLQ